MDRRNYHKFMIVLVTCVFALIMLGSPAFGKKSRGGGSRPTGGGKSASVRSSARRSGVSGSVSRHSSRSVGRASRSGAVRGGGRSSAVRSRPSSATRKTTSSRSLGRSVSARTSSSVRGVMPGLRQERGRGSSGSRRNVRSAAVQSNSRAQSVVLSRAGGRSGVVGSTRNSSAAGTSTVRRASEPANLRRSSEVAVRMDAGSQSRGATDRTSLGGSIAGGSGGLRTSKASSIGRPIGKSSVSAESGRGAVRKSGKSAVRDSGKSALRGSGKPFVKVSDKPLVRDAGRSAVRNSGSVVRSDSAGKALGASKGRRARIGRSIIRGDAGKSGKTRASGGREMGSSKTRIGTNIGAEGKAVSSRTTSNGVRAVRTKSSAAVRKSKAIGGTIRTKESESSVGNTRRAGGRKAESRRSRDIKSGTNGIIRDYKSISKQAGKASEGVRERPKGRSVLGQKRTDRSGLRQGERSSNIASRRDRAFGSPDVRAGHARTDRRRAFERSGPTFSGGKRLVSRRSERLRDRRTGHRRIYRERTEVVRRVDRHEHVYIDRHHHIHRTRIWPSYHYWVYYNWGPSFTFRCFYPYYHRRYVFVSLGGYWPVGYRYIRYYWYGCHPYYWYGYYPIARVVGGDTYNYYTYNYYSNEGAVGAYDGAAYEPTAVDHTTFADVRERLAAQEQEPYEPTLADRYFEDAVEAFGLGDYDLAAELFAKAMELAPEDVIIPYAYCQSLFASGRYTEAAQALRSALSQVSVEAEGVFYPRGLYTDEQVLYGQIDDLAEQGQLYSIDADLQLLLGYQMLGIGELDEAVEPLRLAALDMQNASSATVLLSVLEKLRLQEGQRGGE